jgi:hypothetical protein
MTLLSKCHGAAAYAIDGDPDNGYECSECDEVCEVEAAYPVTLADREYEVARMRGWDD